MGFFSGKKIFSRRKILDPVFENFPKKSRFRIWPAPLCEIRNFEVHSGFFRFCFAPDTFVVTPPSHLQGAPTALEALTMLADTCPVTFYSRPKDISEGVNKEKVMSPQAERFFVELMVEKLVIPTRVDFKPNCEAMVQKAVKVHDKFEFHVNDVDRLPRAMKVLQETVEANGGTQLLKMSATNIGIGVTITIEREEWQKERGHQASSIFKPLRFYDGPSAVAESVVRLAMEGDFQCGANGKAQLVRLPPTLPQTLLPHFLKRDDYATICQLFFLFPPLYFYV